MIVIAIIGILASVAVPAYTTYVKRAQFADVILAATAFKRPSDVASQSDRVSDVLDLDAGQFGIPDNITSGNAVSQHVASVTMLNGIITAVGSADLDNAVYQIAATLQASGGLRWTANESVTNSCFSLGYC